MTQLLSEEHQALAESVRDFAEQVIAPVSAKHDAEHSFPHDVVAQMGSMGLFGIPFPEEHGEKVGTTSLSAWHLKRLRKSTSPWPSLSRLESGLGLCPSSDTARRSRSRSGCPIS